ncbi:MAG: hypothetical protein WBP64_07850, partial [Nitrososphaeraceae archaeon]
MTEKVVDAKELEKVKGFIDDIIMNKSVPSTYNQLTVKIDGANLSENDKIIFNCIRNNPGIIKNDVVKRFENEKGSGYSRVTIFSAIKRLEKEYCMIIVKPGKGNNQGHRLFINNENILVSLFEDLDSFRHAYFNLIDKLDSLLKKERLDFYGFIGLNENLKLVNALLTPFKFILTSYIILELFLPSEKTQDKEFLHKKFELIHDTIRDLQTKLHDTIFKKPLFKSNYGIYHDNFLYDHLGFLSNVLHSSLWGSNYENIDYMLKTFDRYELKDTA